MNKRTAESVSRPIPPYLSRGTGPVAAFHEAAGYMNGRLHNPSGWGYCFTHRGYHGWETGKHLGCVETARMEHLN